MGLAVVWFVLVALLWTGFFVLEGFDFGVGMLHTAGRPLPTRAATVAIDSIGPLLGRQRGLAHRRGRRDVRRLPRLVRDHVLRRSTSPWSCCSSALIVRGVVVRVPRTSGSRRGGGGPGACS